MSMSVGAMDVRSMENMVFHYFDELVELVETGLLSSEFGKPQRKNLRRLGILLYNRKTRRFTLSEKAVLVFYRVKRGDVDG